MTESEGGPFGYYIFACARLNRLKRLYGPVPRVQYAQEDAKHVRARPLTADDRKRTDSDKKLEEL